MLQCSRRSFVLSVAVYLTLTRVRAWAAQPSKLPRVALVYNGVPEAEMVGEKPTSRFAREFIDALRDAGLVDGRDIVLVRRSAEGHPERLPRIMEEVARSSVDLIVTTSPESVRAAMQATNRIPILGLIDGATDSGVISSLARPGANVTGVGIDSNEILGKSLQLVKEIAPGISKIAVIASTQPARRKRSVWRDQLDLYAGLLNLQVLWVTVDAPAEFDAGFATIARQHANALFVQALPINYSNLRTIADRALRQHLPSISLIREFADVGGLMTYGDTDTNRLAADYVKKIIAGTKAGDLPFVQPTTFELAINSTTAKHLGLVIPPSLKAYRPQIIE
jgi:putative ABC transport system substrate-binding protein